FLVELMGDRATLRQSLLQWLDPPLDLEALAAANPFPDVTLEAATDDSGRPAIRIQCLTPNSADVSHHPFQAEIDELVACLRKTAGDGTAGAPMVLRARPQATTLQEGPPNERIQVATLGLGIQGQSDTRSALRVRGVELVAVADVYDGRQTLAREAFGNQVF